MSRCNFIINQKQSLVLKSCPHGIVHLGLGPFTVRIEAQTFYEMAKEIWQFSQALKPSSGQIPQEQVDKSAHDNSQSDSKGAVNKILRMPFFGGKKSCHPTGPN